MKGILFGFVVALAFAIGCVAGASRLMLPEAKASYVVEQRWSYFCFSGSDADSVTHKANAAGARGWELVAAAAPHDSGDAVWCFRQPRP